MPAVTKLDCKHNVYGKQYQYLKSQYLLFSFLKGVGNATACVVQDRIYVTGGHYGYRGSCTYDKIQTYRADINEWSIATISPHPGRALILVHILKKFLTACFVKRFGGLHLE